MSNISVEQIIPWLEDYDPQAFLALQAAVTNTDSQLDSFITPVLQKINNWKSKHSVMAFQDVLTSVFQGRILGVTIPKCIDLYSCDGFFKYIRSRPTGFKWLVEYENVAGGGSDEPTTQVVTNAELINWVERITNLTTETSAIDSFKDSVHTASSNHVYNSIFRPKSMTQVAVGGSTLDYIFETQGYNKLYTVLNPSLPAPNYK